METNGVVSAAEASAALESVQDSRSRVAWTGYPAWYWLGTAAGMAAMPFLLLLPGWWDLAGAVVLAASLLRIAVLACRVRGVCEGWIRAAMRWREGVLLYGPPVVVLLADGVVVRWALWPPVLVAAISAALVFVSFAGTGFLLGARAARR